MHIAEKNLTTYFQMSHKKRKKKSEWYFTAHISRKFYVIGIFFCQIKDNISDNSLNNNQVQFSVHMTTQKFQNSVISTADGMFNATKTLVCNFSHLY